jgi:hypothetical protein
MSTSQMIVLDTSSSSLSRRHPPTLQHTSKATVLLVLPVQIILFSCVVTHYSTGVISNYKKSFLQLKSKTSALILDKLRDATQMPVSRMYYVKFDENITAQHGVVLKNWPLKKFASPGDIGPMVEVKTVYNGFMSGMTKFHKLMAAEWQEWEEVRLNLEHTDEGGNYGTMFFNSNYGVV